MRYADLVYYGKVCTINYLDPRLIEAYQAPDAATATRALKGAGVDFVLFNYSNRHLIDHTQIGKALFDDGELVFFAADEIETWYLYKLDSRTQHLSQLVADLACEPITACKTSKSGDELQLPLRATSKQSSLNLIGGGKPYRIDAKLSGNGLATLRFIRRDGGFSNPFWRGLLKPGASNRITIDVALPADAAYLPVVAVGSSPQSELTVQSLNISR
ncbi:hypothetical protein ASC97_32285 [Rhizobium sp. Root1203]|nr:hypothetical protein ASC97_32285 [Rhizobium sp. Root1203]